MDVIGHDHEGMELKARFGTLLLKKSYEEGGVVVNLEKSTARGSDACYEVSSEFLWSL
jgi:hypothetical protein